MNRWRTAWLVAGAFVAWYVYTDLIIFAARRAPEASNPISVVVRGLLQ